VKSLHMNSVTSLPQGIHELGRVLLIRRTSDNFLRRSPFGIMN
jgi:hypothetical protein